MRFAWCGLALLALAGCGHGPQAAAGAPQVIVLGIDGMSPEFLTGTGAIYPTWITCATWGSSSSCGR